MRNRRLLVRVHRWISMVLGAWICLIAVTGFILVFRADLERWTRPELYRHGEGPPVSPDQAVAAVAAEFPDRYIGEVTMPAHNGGVYKVENESDTRDYTTFVDPATGRINGSVDDDGGFLNVTYRLHEDLMQDRILGMDGDVFVAWLTVAWVVTVLSGFVIWYWPRVKRRVRIRRHRGPFTFTMDLHKLLGIASLVPVTLVMLTGIDFAFEDKVETFWEKATPAGEEHIGGPEELESVDDGDRPLTFDQALAVVAPLYPRGEVTEISMPDEDEPTGTVQVSVTQGWDPRRGMLGEAGNVRVELDRMSGRVLYVGNPDDYNVWTQFYDRWTFPLHTGSFGGFATRLLWLAVAATPAFLFVSGVRMWFIRRAKRRARTGPVLDVREPRPQPEVPTPVEV